MLVLEYLQDKIYLYKSFGSLITFIKIWTPINVIRSTIIINYLFQLLY